MYLTHFDYDLTLSFITKLRSLHLASYCIVDFCLIFTILFSRMPFSNSIHWCYFFQHLNFMNASVYAEFKYQKNGCHYSLDWTTGLEYWSGRYFLFWTRFSGFHTFDILGRSQFFLNNHRISVILQSTTIQ